MTQTIDPEFEGPVRSSRFLIALWAAAALGAAVMPGRPLGLSLSLVAVLVIGASALEERGSLRPVDIALAAASCLLATMFLFRAAGWVLAVDAAAALMIAGAALTSARRTVPLVTAAFLPFALLLHGLRLALRPLGRVTSSAGARLGPLAKGGAAAAVLLVVFGALFVSADRAFAQLAYDVVVPEWRIALLPARVLTLLLVLAVGGALVRTASMREALPAGVTILGAGPRWKRVEWLPPLVVLNALFGAFVAVQFAVLFGGRDHVLETAGLTYAQYARQGFFQLLVAAGLTLLLVAMAWRLAARGERGEDLLLRSLLGLLCGCTLVILASAFKRLVLYEDTFGLTRARIGAHTIIVWLGVVLVLVMIAGAIRKTTWLPVGVVLASASVLLGLNALDPDSLIARRNVMRYERTGQIDVSYLSTLSPDAVPELSRLHEPLRTCVLEPIAAGLEDEDRSLWSLNFGRDTAIETLNQWPLQEGGCEWDS